MGTHASDYLQEDEEFTIEGDSIQTFGETQMMAPDSTLFMALASQELAANEFFELSLKIHYETKLGEYLAVIGDIEELGSWKQVKVVLKWTEGHIWATEEPLKLKHKFFRYKYVVVNSKGAKTWEKGRNRICDLRILASEQEGRKQVTLKDTWDCFRLKLQLVHDSADGDKLYVEGLGHAKRSQLEESVLRADVADLYDGNLFTVGLQMRQTDAKALSYQYVIERPLGSFEVQRQTSSLRRIIFQDAAQYTGHPVDIEEAQKQGDDRVFLINGRAIKFDGTFV